MYNVLTNSSLTEYLAHTLYIIFFPFNYLDWDVGVDVLAEECRVDEHICHCDKRNDVTQHVTGMVGNKVLDEWENASANNHHHEDS